ncbi:hypothetical protein KQI84_07335 [bacterium]|nr:hypothetical protein [bacterium]
MAMISFVIMLFGSLSMIAGLLCHGMRRELNPTRRRDLTLAGAATAHDLAERTKRTSQWALNAAITMGGVGIVGGWIVGPIVPSNLISKVFVGLFVGAACLLPATFWCYGVVWGCCLQACRRNKDLSYWTEPLAVLFSSPALGIVWLLKEAVLIIALWVAPWGRTAVIFVSFLTVLFALVVGVAVIVLIPGVLRGHFVRAYPYRE